MLISRSKNEGFWNKPSLAALRIKADTCDNRKLICYALIE